MRVTHATPSALYAYTANRRWECEHKLPLGAARCKDIARQLVEDLPGRDINVTILIPFRLPLVPMSIHLSLSHIKPVLACLLAKLAACDTRSVEVLADREGRLHMNESDYLMNKSFMKR